MRTIEIQTNGKTYLVVDLPDRVKGVEGFYLPDFKIEPVGFALSLTENEWAEIVHESKRLFGGKFYNYKKKANVANTATESGKSWMEANGISDFINPFILIKK